MGNQIYFCYTDAPMWHDILSILSLEDKFQVNLHGKNNAIVELRGRTTIRSGNPCTQMLWNVNGFASRWTNNNFVEEEDILSAKQTKKKRQCARKQEKADFRSIILKAGSPDLITIIESKLSLNKMLSLPGFISWCEKMKYYFITLSWSSSEIKGGAGYAGVMTLNKFRPISTTLTT